MINVHGRSGTEGANFKRVVIRTLKFQGSTFFFGIYKLKYMKLDSYKSPTISTFCGKA